MIELLELGLVVNDVLPRDMNVKQGLIVNLGVYSWPQLGIDNEMECHTREGLGSKLNGESHLLDVRTIQVKGGTPT